MICPKCSSENVNVQMVTETKMVNKHGIVYFLTIGWIISIFKWIFFTLPALLTMFLPKSKKLKQKHVSMAVCQSCGHNWKV